MQRIILVLLTSFLLLRVYSIDSTVTQKTNRTKPELNNAGLILPTGFSAVAMADSVGKARHIVVSKKGVIYVKLSKLINGKGILRLQDTNDDGKIDDVKSFCNYIGTGITIKDGYLY
ncbi:MAG TPA: hypothetical protein VK173_09505, partial [Lacibacter sp.]|nr:hypothetical protein [Lacibacter sp.]